MNELTTTVVHSDYNVAPFFVCTACGDENSHLNDLHLLECNRTALIETHFECLGCHKEYRSYKAAVECCLFECPACDEKYTSEYDADYCCSRANIRAMIGDMKHDMRRDN